MRIAVDGSWARSDTEKEAAFTKHSEKLFFPHLLQTESKLSKIPVATKKRSSPFRAKQITQVFKEQINLKKAPGYDQITREMLKELPEIAIIQVTHIFIFLPQGLEDFGN